ncbi:hypothetical protein PCANC_17076 [Puccinia coronata f. sp. avenae]|uniref:BZIP domain-containing protein n=1 Tax=Puccinia coronata f. sp. avenae TaxID=200324 RepID=A0A2N5SLD7_9BASI|nr:hypothetical protein PCANC_17076 [Puccinia coronata f. sp. avenae]
MAQSISSQSITYHGIGHTHNAVQNLNPPNQSTISQPNALHTTLTHTHPTDSSSASYQHHHRKSSQENDEEAIARKKKNADAQAAFRQRRQTYIKSLEVTVTELKGAVTEMEFIVKTTSHEAKHQKQRAEYLEFKLKAYESGELKSAELENHQHCKCCKFAPPDFNLHPSTSTNAAQQQGQSLSTPTTSAITVSPTADCPTPSGPAILTSTLAGHDNMNRDWSSRQGAPPMLQTDSNHRSTPHHPSGQNSPNRVPHSTTSLDHPRNILHHQHQSSSSLHNNPSYPRSNCDLAMFTPFGAAENPSTSNFYPSSNDANHGSTAQSVCPDSTAGGPACPMEMGPHPNHLQANAGHLYDRSPPVRQSNSLGNAYSPIGNSQSFDAHHSGTLSSPRLWSHNNTSAYANTEHNSTSNYAGIDGTIPDIDASGFRLQRGIGERSVMRPADYLPSLELRPIPLSYPVSSALSSPRADNPYGILSSKARSSKRRWHDDKLGPRHDTHELDDAPTSGKTGVKLNGIPAKVARCEQVCTEVSKVVFQMKEEVKAVTATKPPTTPSSAHQSVSPNATASNTFPSPLNAQHNSHKVPRVKFSGPSSQLTSSSAALPVSHHEESHVGSDDRRFQNMNN